MPNPDVTMPATTWQGILASRRTLFGVGLVLFLFAVAGLFSSLVRSRTALITADPYSYLLFAQELAGGHLHMTGPLAEAVAHFAENEELMQGPIWNTHVLPDGRTLFTIALGYPLFLSLALTLGGTWLYTTINVGVLVCVVLALAWCVWEGWDRTLTGFLMGAAASLWFIHSHPATFLQFSHPWREPLFYFCVLVGIGCLARFLAKTRMGYLVPAGLLLGFACAIKEANAIYALWLGMYVLVSTSWRRHPRRMAALALFVGCGVVGMAPLLIQNGVATGNPLLSTQFMRATSNYGVQEVAAGLNQHNMGSTLSRYVFLYRDLPAFHPLWVGVAAIGILANFKRPAMHLLVGVFAAHLALYLQWGNADFRHSFFAHIPYSIFVLAGLVWVLQLPFARVRGAYSYRQWAALVPLLVLAGMAPPWPRGESTEATFSHGHAVGLVEALDGEMPSGGVLLSNRNLRDVLGVYGRFPVIRLHDLAAFHPAGDYAEVIDWLKRNGHPVFFLDNRDLDPRNVGKIRWDKLDARLLLDAFDLARVAVLDSRALHIVEMTAGQPLTLYRVDAWPPGPLRRDIAVPGEGAAFLFLNPRTASPLTCRLDGAPFALDPTAGFYQPVPTLEPGRNLVFEWENGGTVPALKDLRLVSHFEVIEQDCAADALPSDQHVFPEGGLIGEPGNSRRFFAPMVLRIPVRQTPEQFTTLGLGLNFIGETTNLGLYASLPGQEPMPCEITMNAAWFPALLPDPGPVARSVEVTLTSDADAHLKMTRWKSIPVRRSVSRKISTAEAGVAVVGRMAPDVPGVGPHAWSATVNGSPAYSGRCFDDPRRSLNAFRALFEHTGAETDIHIAFEGGGLVDAEWVSVKDRIDIRAGAAAMAFVASGMHEVEQIAGARFCWSAVRTEIRVPVGPDTGAYELILRAADGHPRARRPLTVRFGGQSRAVELPQDAGEVRLTFAAPPVDHPSLRELILEIDPWSPHQDLDLQDDRQLGFIFYGMSWHPVESTDTEPERPNPVP